MGLEPVPKQPESQKPEEKGVVNHRFKVDFQIVATD
jgi:hypothetical protein